MVKTGLRHGSDSVYLGSVAHVQVGQLKLKGSYACIAGVQVQLSSLQSSLLCLSPPGILSAYISEHSPLHELYKAGYLWLVLAKH